MSTKRPSSTSTLNEKRNLLLANDYLINQTISNNTNVIATNTTGVARTPGIIRPNNVIGNLNTIVATFYSVSIANVGAANGTVLGTVIKTGEILNFSADAVNNFFTSFAYDATGTEFIIIYVA